MATIQGRLGRVAVSSDGGATFFDVGCLVDATLNGAQAEINVTCHDSGQFEQFLPGRKDATLDLSLRWDESDAGQSILTSSYFSGTPIQARFRLQEGAGFTEFLVNCFVTSYSPTSPNDDAADLEVTLRVSGQFDAALQA